MPTRAKPRSAKPCSKSGRVRRTHTSPTEIVSARAPVMKCGCSSTPLTATAAPRTIVSTRSPTRLGNAMVAYSLIPSTASAATTTPKSQVGHTRIRNSSVGIATAAVQSLARSTQSFPYGRFHHAAEAPLPVLKMGQCLEEVTFPKVGPQGLGEIDLGVCALPEEEVRDTHLAAGPNEEVRIG